MIQRIQTVYLLIASIISGGLIFVFDLGTVSDQKVFALDLLTNSESLLKTIPIAFIVSTLLSVAAIFLFKNRQLQFVLGRLNILTNFYLLGVLIYLSLTVSGGMQISKKGIGMFFPVLIIILLVFANKAIKKDEDLVKSADRLR